MGNPKTSDDLYGAFLPTSRITEVSDLSCGDWFSFMLNGQHRISIKVGSSDDDQSHLVWAEFAEGPRRTLLAGPKEECFEEYFAIYRFLLNRWQREMASPRHRFRNLSFGDGVAVSGFIAFVAALGLWLQASPEPSPNALSSAVLSGLLQADDASQAAPLVPAKQALRAGEPVSAPSFLEKVSKMKAPEERVVVLPADASATGGEEAADLLERFGLPEGPGDASVDPTEDLRKQYLDSFQDGIATFPDPDGILAKKEDPVLQMPGGGTLEGMGDLLEFGLEP
jgi:hypothetical protein